MLDRYDVVIVGAGSGGIGAALAAARAGLDVLLVEKADVIGGTAARAGVSSWEPGVGGTGFPFEIYKRLKQIQNAVGILSTGPTGAFPGAAYFVDGRLGYSNTLRRYGARGMSTDQAIAFWERLDTCHSMTFEPEAYCQVVEQMLAETGRCTLLKGTTFTQVTTASQSITCLELDDGRQVSASFYVDATADALLALACGCETMIGQESKDAFGEPDAPDEATRHLNGATLIYRVTPTDSPGVEPLPDDVSSECWWRESFPVPSVRLYSCGDLNINMLPTMEGWQVFELGDEAVYPECRRRVLAHWHHLQTAYPALCNYRLHGIAPALGVREGRRVVGEYVLTEHDLLSGLRGQSHDDVIAIADHGMDTHGSTTGRAGSKQLSEPYGVPYRCLIPKGFDNLLVACRGASFSSLAASSCRLSRTMIQLGQAAGTAVAVAKELGTSLPDVPPGELRARLRAQHVQLDWPTQHGLSTYLGNESEDQKPCSSV